jgi:hypothetical protein
MGSRRRTSVSVGERISKATGKPATANNRFNRTVRKRPAG